MQGVFHTFEFLIWRRLQNSPLNGWERTRDCRSREQDESYSGVSTAWSTTSRISHYLSRRCEEQFTAPELRHRVNVGRLCWVAFALVLINPAHLFQTFTAVPMVILGAFNPRSLAERDNVTSLAFLQYLREIKRREEREERRTSLLIRSTIFIIYFNVLFTKLEF